jgi:1-acyl-sn-glycerol-3-phosphate acyltransferase
MIGWLRVGFGFVAIALATVPVALFQPIVLRTGVIDDSIIPRLWHRAVARILGIRLHVTGAMAVRRPLLIAANHISWTDIIVLGAVADVCFIAKADMSRWPVMGWLCTMQRTVFVERRRRGESGRQASEIGARIAAGDAMVLFAEGTTSDGNLLMPFNSTLFEAAKLAVKAAPDGEVFIQPVAVAYTRLQGIPMGRRRRGHVAWIGDQDLLPHAVGVLREGAVDAEVRFGEPLRFDAATDRKEAARLVEARVRSMLSSALRDPLPSRAPEARPLSTEDLSLGAERG